MFLAKTDFSRKLEKYAFSGKSVCLKQKYFTEKSTFKASLKVCFFKEKPTLNKFKVCFFR
jgi:hypothetical protein